MKLQLLMGSYMKSPKIQWQEIDYLSSDLMESFARSYSHSFPELKLDQAPLVNFLNQKFRIIHSEKFHNIAALSTKDGVVASGYGIIRNNYSFQDKQLTVGLVCDVFTDSEFRKMGLFKKVSLLAISREEATKTNFLIGFPIRDEVMPGHLSVGWKYVFDMPIWWAFPRFGSIKNVVRNPTFSSITFAQSSGKLAVIPTNEFLEWRFSFFNVDYFLITVPHSEDFAIARKSKLRSLPFTCIVFMQSSNEDSSRILIRKIRNLSLCLGTLGVLGCWNKSYAADLFLEGSGLRKSSKFQKVIVRELNGFACPDDEVAYRLSWMDSDTL